MYGLKNEQKLQGRHPEMQITYFKKKDLIYSLLNSWKNPDELCNVT